VVVSRGECAAKDAADAAVVVVVVVGGVVINPRPLANDDDDDDGRRSTISSGLVDRDGFDGGAARSNPSPDLTVRDNASAAMLRAMDDVDLKCGVDCIIGEVFPDGCALFT